MAAPTLPAGCCFGGRARQKPAVVVAAATVVVAVMVVAVAAAAVAVVVAATQLGSTLAGVPPLQRCLWAQAAAAAAAEVTRIATWLLVSSASPISPVPP